MEGPTLPISDEIHAMKHRLHGETFREQTARIANALKDNDVHYEHFRDILLKQRFLPGGRVQAAMGSPKIVTAYNCFVSQTIEDSMSGIMDALSNAAQTMRMGGGIGYDFSPLRPAGTNISTLGTPSSGPVSFMGPYDAVCKTIASAGHRRGAQMAVLRVDHPDIEQFISAKHNEDQLTQFNMSIAVTDDFMTAVMNDDVFNLEWGGRIYKTVNARNLWDKIMRSTWDWAEPGVIFIDEINRMNNLFYCEEIAATNPCGEQPLPPYGSCLLGSVNLTKYIDEDDKSFNELMLKEDIHWIIRSMDNVIDRTIYPLKEQEIEAKNKRRMGIGITGYANTISYLGMEYGSPKALRWLHDVLNLLANTSYQESALLAREKGKFPLYEDTYNHSEFVKRLSSQTRDMIRHYGLRNSHLTSIAPTGTISLTADNISSGIEPAFSQGFERTIQTYEGVRKEFVPDYAWYKWGIKSKYADDCDVKDHLDTLIVAQEWVDSAVSKTCNVGNSVSFDAFKEIYMKAWHGGAKGCTTFRPAGKRYGILNTNEEGTNEATACYFDPKTGKKSCE